MTAEAVAPIRPATATTPLERARRIGRDVAAVWADDVDRRARFPHEALEALRSSGLLTCAIPAERGGEGVSLAQLCGVTRELGRHCASTALVFAMHHSQLLTLVRHADTPALHSFVDDIASNAYLLASATTEISTGGDIGRSGCALEHTGDRVRLTKQAPVISYGEYADAVLVTARRTADSTPDDQALTIARKSDVTLEKTSEWDTMGLRGTCSSGYALTLETDAGLVWTTPYSHMSAATMTPVAHTLWAAAWLGIADAAVSKASACVRSAARRNVGSLPLGAPRMATLAGLHQQFSDNVTMAAARFDALITETTSAPRAALVTNSLKVTASTMVVDIVGHALLVCGIAGYREDSKFALGRHLRDAHGAAVMVNNDRIMDGSAQLALTYRGTL